MAKELTILPSLEKSFNCTTILSKQQASALHVATHPTQMQICPSRKALGTWPHKGILLKPPTNFSEINKVSSVYLCKRPATEH